jgi:hypothetical protein
MSKNSPFNEAASLGCPEGFEVFVGKMPLGTTETDLMKVAGPYNPYSVRVLSKPDRAGMMCGFVSFLHVKGSQDFIRDVNETCAFGGHTMCNIRFADGKTRKKIFFGGLPEGTNEQDLMTLASHYGTILSVKILSTNHKVPCGFVVFASPVHAEQCVQELNGKPNGTGNKYVARFAKAPETKAQRKRSGSRDMKRTAPDAIHNTPLVSAGHSMLLHGHTMNTAHRFYRSDTPSSYSESGHGMSQHNIPHSFPQDQKRFRTQAPPRDMSGKHAMTPSTVASLAHHDSPQYASPQFQYQASGGLGQLVVNGQRQSQQLPPQHNFGMQQTAPLGFSGALPPLKPMIAEQHIISQEDGYAVAQNSPGMPVSQWRRQSTDVSYGSAFSRFEQPQGY